MNAIEKKFNLMGASVALTKSTRQGYNIDIQKGKFLITSDGDVEISVVDVDAGDRHLLLNVKETGFAGPKRTKVVVEKHKFLCGHDERDWFVAAVPEKFSWVKNVREAKDALKPDVVHKVEKAVRGKAKNKRKNAARVRQGEWFFIPAPNLVIGTGLTHIIHKNEPISRGGGSKSHYVEEVYRTGGYQVMVCNNHPGGLTMPQYERALRDNPDAKNWNWRSWVRDAGVYGRGYVKHADHATIFLDGWHQILMNTESGASSRRNMSFLD